MREGRAVRKPLSCGPCRSRKLRCDRGMPACSNCVHRGDIIECSYARSDRQTTARLSRPISELSSSAQDKLDYLEKLVVTLLDGKRETQQIATPSTTNGSSSIVPQYSGVDTDAGSEHVSNEVHDSIDRNGPSATSLYADSENDLRWSVDEARWESLLNGINDVRTHLQKQRQQYEEQAEMMSSLLHRGSSNSCGPALLFGSSQNVSIVEILSHLPSRYSCDVMVERYFAHLYPPMHILHPPTFRKQYARFWEDQCGTSIIWVGLLFSILRIAMLDYLREGDEPIEWQDKCKDMALNFRSRFTDCLIVGDYLQPHEFLIEALCLHYYGEYVSSRDAKSSVWVLLGMITRLAMRMGYHKTAQPTLHTSPFKSEMRRRVWAFIRQGDIMISFQLGLPAMVDLSASDSNLPRNIYDQDFDEDSTSLSVAHPPSEPTEVGYLLTKTKLAFGFARAAAEISRPLNIKWERVLEMDRELRQIYDTSPDVYKLGLLSAEDSLILTSAKMTLANIHYKSLCVLHSRFAEAAESDSRYMYSRKVCLNSSMSMLRIQAIQDQEIPVGGRVRSLTNYQTSLTIHDFLLATAIISSHLSSSHPRTLSPGMPSRVEMIKALRISADIFRRMRTQSKEANIAADVLSMLVAKFEDETGTSSSGRYETGHRARERQTLGNATDRPCLNQNQSGIAITTPVVGGQNRLSSSSPLVAGNVENTRLSQLNNLWDHSSAAGHSRAGLLSPNHLSVFDFGLNEQDRDTAMNPQVSGFPWPAGMDGRMRDAYNIPHHASLDDFQPSQLMNSHQSYPSIAMNDPLSTLFDLNGEYSNDVL